MNSGNVKISVHLMTIKKRMIESCNNGQLIVVKIIEKA